MGMGKPYASQKKKQDPPKREQLRLPPPERPDEVSGTIMEGRSTPNITSFNGLRPALLALLNDNLADHAKMRKETDESITEKPSSAVYLRERTIKVGIELSKTLAGMVPIGFYPAIDPEEHVIDAETERLKAMTEIMARPIENLTGDVEVS